MDTQTLFDFVKKNWRDREKLTSLVGQAYSGSTNRDNSSKVTFCWGTVPTEQAVAVISLENGTINRVQTWSRLNWSAKYGWGDAFRDTQMETYRNG